MDDAEDNRLARELLADEKERAEHLMLVDLARNDIGRVSTFGSVSVPEFMEIEKFSHVQHIVSRVCGTVAEGKDRFDALASCFPGRNRERGPKDPGDADHRRPRIIPTGFVCRCSRGTVDLMTCSNLPLPSGPSG